ncbi:hypothetical protein BDB00DRAFT_13630 [Zychaea mexicana]|uniref:uncharacterized protein n=1 Tax=Zychaea mexicana TaxID=64656 RepID=UPI0022FE533E|nr:uncharacterized protein BDB00DRAFT_13630 [Zychaea mexicana]KAI9499714.1 hypothetical protein BDB00DRAFT_13630 [Zychaea mexicana]
MNANMHMLYTSALWQLQNTLTCLELFFASCNTEISLSSLLFYCPNIEKLVFSARSATLASLIGDLELMGGSHRALVDLDLDTGIATGEALEAILKRCPKLRRLSVFGCEPSVLDVIHEGRCCPDLVIFGYSPSFEIVQLNELEDESVGPGLRALYTPNGGTGAPADKLLPLLKKHAKTLQRVYANMEEESQDYDNNPSLFEEPLGFERLMKLTYWPEEHIETLFLRSLGSSLGSVTFFSPTCSSNIPAFTDVMLKLTSLQDMEIARASSEEGEDHAASQLVQMCKTYAALPESQQTMRMLRFWYCSCLNDDVLSAMTELKTLTTIELAGESRVTTQGLVRFFKRMNKAATVKKVCLQDIDAVDDCVLNAIASMSHLETLEMDDMSTVTDIGLQDVIDSVKTLRNLKLEGCDTFSEEALLYARSKIKHFEKC